MNLKDYYQNLWLQLTPSFKFQRDLSDTTRLSEVQIVVESIAEGPEALDRFGLAGGCYPLMRCLLLTYHPNFSGLRQPPDHFICEPVCNLFSSKTSTYHNVPF